MAPSANNGHGVYPVKFDREVNTDILIVGSGPIGAVFARYLVETGKRKVLMIDIGQQETRLVGDHKKNSVAVQKDISRFTNTVKGELHPLSVPTSKGSIVIEPSSWSPEPGQTTCILNGQNPHQQEDGNLPAAAATRVVGGMGSHWTCCTPRQHPEVERSPLFDDKRWDELYGEMERLLDTNSTTFDNSIRQQLIKGILSEDADFGGREVRSMPLACRRSEHNKDYVRWSCTATILGDLADPKHPDDAFELRANTQCDRIVMDTIDPNVIVGVLAKDLEMDVSYLIKANKYVICAGAVLTPGILAKSGFGDTLPALGCYMMEQPMAFCQVVLEKKHIQKIEKNPAWSEAVRKHKEKHSDDPLPIPFKDPEPQCYFPLDNDHPWHTQIHRDAFGYGEVPPAVDQRLVVDLRWFTYSTELKESRVVFKGGSKDQFGMPQPTFEFRMTEQDKERTKNMITDMIKVARKLGSFLPGAEPKYLAPGSALHICGTHRAGKDKNDSVVDRHGKVWGQEKLVLGGCGVIPKKNACNPTITAGCFALAAAQQIVKDLEAKGIPSGLKVTKSA